MQKTPDRRSGVFFCEGISVFKVTFNIFFNGELYELNELIFRNLFCKQNANVSQSERKENLFAFPSQRNVNEDN